MVIQPTNSDFSQHNAVKSTNWDGIGQYGSPLPWVYGMQTAKVKLSRIHGSMMRTAWIHSLWRMFKRIGAHVASAMQVKK